MHFGPSGGTCPRTTRRNGFSLIEVALSLTVAAGGMVAIFGLFPGGMRQGANSNRDLVGAAFAGSALAAMAGNVRSIDDVAIWNDPEAWWTRAVENTGLPGWKGGQIKAQSPGAFRSDSKIFAPNRSMVEDIASSKASTVYFFADDDGERTVNPGGISLPPHYIVRLARIRRKPRKIEYSDLRGYVNAVERYGTKTQSEAEDAADKMRAPDRYIVSIVSSDQKGYAIFVNEPVYSQEFHFLQRP